MGVVSDFSVRTAPGSTPRTGLPESPPYQWRGAVATPAEIVARLHSEIAARRSACEDGRHYFAKQGGQWVCTMCGATR